MSIKRDFYGHPGAKYFLWRIKMYYKKKGLEFPASIAEAMATVPDTQPAEAYIFYSQEPTDPFADIKRVIRRIGK